MDDCNLLAKTEKLNLGEAQNAKTMTEIEAAQTQAKQTSQQLRAALHEDVDKYCDVIDKRIDSHCQDVIKSACIPRVNLERNPDWSLEGAVNLQLEFDVIRTPEASKAYVKWLVLLLGYYKSTSSIAKCS